MTKNRMISAIELGSSKIVTLIAQLQEDEVIGERKIKVVGVSSVSSKGIKKGQIVNIEEAVDTAVTSIEGAERMAGFNLSTAYIALGGANILSQNSHGVVAVSDPGGEIGEDDVERVIEAASAISLPSSREVVHVVPRDFTVDGETGVKDPVGMSGVRLEVETHIVTSSTASIKNLKKAINEVGVSIDGLVFSGIAASESSLTPTEKELGCVLVDIGGGTTSISIFTEGSVVYSGVIPVGARNVTNDLAIGLRVSLESAEKIKLALKNEEKDKKNDSDVVDLSAIGVSEITKVSRKTLVEGIVRPRLNEIFTMVRLELDKNELSSQTPSGVIVTGGGSDTVGVEDSAKRMLSLPVRLGKPSGINGIVDDIIDPAFSVPVGLLIYASKQIPVEHSGFSRKLKLPTSGIAGKLINTVRDLLP